MPWHVESGYVNIYISFVFYLHVRQIITNFAIGSSCCRNARSRAALSRRTLPNADGEQKLAPNYAAGIVHAAAQGNQGRQQEDTAILGKRLSCACSRLLETSQLSTDNVLDLATVDAHGMFIDISLRALAPPPGQCPGGRIVAVTGETLYKLSAWASRCSFLRYRAMRRPQAVERAMVRSPRFFCIAP